MSDKRTQAELQILKMALDNEVEARVSAQLRACQAEHKLRQETEHTIHIHEKLLDEMAQTLCTERQLWQEAETTRDSWDTIAENYSVARSIEYDKRRAAEQRAEHAEALAQLVTPELARLLERLAKYVPYTLHPGIDIGAQACALAARIKAALEADGA